MPMQLFINGVDRSADMIWKTISISESPQANGFTMSVSLMIYDDQSPVPLGKQTIKLLNAQGGVEFAGRVNEVSDPIRDNNLWARYDLTCVDWTDDYDTHLIEADFGEQLAGDVIRRVTGLVGRGFTSNNVVDGSTVGGFQSDYERPSDVNSRVAESIEHQWYIDYDRDVHFFYIRDLDAPIPQINFEEDTNTFFDFTVREDVTQVKNRIYLSGGKVSSGSLGEGGLKDTIITKGDGDSKFIPLNYEPAGLAANQIEVKLDGVPLTIKQDSVDGFAGDGQGSADEVFICLDNWGVRFADDHPPAEDSDIEISYDYTYEPLVVVEDPESIAYMRSREHAPGAPSDGVHEFRYNMPEIRFESENALIDYGNLLLLRYAWPIVHVQFGSWIQGWKPTQRIRIISVTHGLDREFFVKQLTKRPVVNFDNYSFFQYALTLSTSPFPT